MRNNRKIIYACSVLLAVLTAILSVAIFSTRKHSMKVIFLDVGQGDAILMQQGNKQVLIDGGKDGKILLEKLGKYIPFWDRNIEMVIETHPDADHIGGLIDLFGAYQVEAVMKTHMPSQSQTFKKLEDDIISEQSQVVEALGGEIISFPDGTKMEVVFPFASEDGADEKNTNAASVVAKLVFGESSFLFTGDLPFQQEQEIVDRGIDVKSDVLKVGHHGSKYSSSGEFLDAVGAKDAVISVGKNNTYGHPNQEALARIVSHHMNIIRTDEVGDIEYDCQDSKCIRVIY